MTDPVSKDGNNHHSIKGESVNLVATTSTTGKADLIEGKVIIALNVGTASRQSSLHFSHFAHFDIRNSLLDVGYSLISVVKNINGMTLK